MGTAKGIIVEQSKSHICCFAKAEISKVMNGESLNRDEEIDDIDDNDKTPSLVSVPKSGAKNKPKKGDGGLKPQAQN